MRRSHRKPVASGVLDREAAEAMLSKRFDAEAWRALEGTALRADQKERQEALP